MLVVHHLNNSRSQRILWLLEELNAPHQIEHYQRDPQTHLAPDSLKRVHPLGKAPVITEDGKTIAESGAIIDYILRHYGNGRLAPPMDSDDYDAYVEWLQYAESSLALPLMMGFFAKRLGIHNDNLDNVVAGGTKTHLSFMEDRLSQSDYLAGDAFSAADIQNAFMLEFASASGLLTPYPQLTIYLERLQARPAYKQAIEKGGPYSLKFE